jgi:hypothetical protein
VGIEVGTSVGAMTTGDGGIVVTTMYSDVGPGGMLAGVTNGVVNLLVYDGVGIEAILVEGIVEGTMNLGTITAVVDWMVMINGDGIVDGRDLPGTMTGEGGNELTTMYYEVGPAGIEFGVTNGVVNLTVYGGDGKWFTITAHLLMTVDGMCSGTVITTTVGTVVGRTVLGTITIEGLLGIVTIKGDGTDDGT